MQERERQNRLRRQLIASQMEAQGATPAEISRAINPDRKVDDSLGRDELYLREPCHIDLPPPYNPN